MSLKLKNFLILLSVCFSSLLFQSLNHSPLHADQLNVEGVYHAILNHGEGQYFQHARITLRTRNPDGQMRISANVRVIFGAPDSSEFLTYDFSDVPLNILTRQISLSNEQHDISMIGYLKDDQIYGDWYSSLTGKVGSFVANKDVMPDIGEDRVLVEALSGNYRGQLKNENPQSNLPEKVMASFVSSQSSSDQNIPRLRISGNSRFYLGDFTSLEYVEIEFNDIQFNYFNRFLTAKTSQFGFTFKGYLAQNGDFHGELYSDGLGYVGSVVLNKYHLSKPGDESFRRFFDPQPKID